MGARPMRFNAREIDSVGIVLGRINDILFAFGGVLIGLMMITICYDVVMRSFGHPTLWVEEFNEIAILYMVFFALAGASKKGVHVSIDFVVTKYNPRVKALFGVIYSIVTSSSVQCSYGGAPELLSTPSLTTFMKTLFWHFPCGQSLSLFLLEVFSHLSST
jgi:hypothetical protein